MGELIKEFQAELNELPHYELSELVADFEYESNEYKKYAEYGEQFAIDFLEFLSNEFYPKLGVIEYALKNNLYKEFIDDESKRVAQLNQITDISDRAESLANEVIKNHPNIPMPEMDMTKEINDNQNL